MKRISIAFLFFAFCGLSVSAQHNKTAKTRTATVRISTTTAVSHPEAKQGDAKIIAEKKRIEAEKKNARKQPASEAASDGYTN